MDEKKPAPPTQPRLIGKKIYLRPATAEDVGNTYHWFLQSDPTIQSCSAHAMLTPAQAAESYRKREHSPDDQLLLIVDLKTNIPVGTIRFFKMNHLNRSVELGILVDPDERRHGHALEAIRVLTRYLFMSRDMNKIYAETSSLNAPAVKLVEKAGFKRDAVLRHQHFYDGEFHDGYVYSMLRYEFER